MLSCLAIFALAIDTALLAAGNLVEEPTLEVERVDLEWVDFEEDAPRTMRGCW